jgi:hypothetical protein
MRLKAFALLDHSKDLRKEKQLLISKAAKFKHDCHNMIAILPEHLVGITPDRIA